MRKQLKVKIQLLSDAIFGSGKSVPGGEHITITCDEQGFPYYPASAFKGILKSELENYLSWCGIEKKEQEIMAIFGRPHTMIPDSDRGIKVSDFKITEGVRSVVLETMKDSEEVLDSFTYFRAFTSIGQNGMVQDGSLRTCRCLLSGLLFFGEIECAEQDLETVKAGLKCMKWIGSMRNRGFGRVKICICGEDCDEK